MLLRHGKQRALILFTLFTMVTGLLGPVMNVARADAAIYYVGGDNASDDNPGTMIAPFATIQRAADEAEAGDTVRIRSGTYRETIVPANSGTEESPIVYEPDDDAVVTVSGADVVDGDWTVHSGSIYKKSISMTSGYNDSMTDNTTLMANQVFVDGKMMIEARWPNVADSDDVLNRNDYRDGKIGAWSGSTITDEAIPDIPGGWTGGTIWVNGWFISQTRTIAAHSGHQLTMSGGSIAGPFRDFYYLTGKLGALDAPKEFFYDGEDLYLYAPDGGVPAGVEVKKRNYAFDLSGKSFITINKLNIFAATITTNTDSAGITLDGIDARYINHNVTLTDADVIYSHTGQIVREGAAGIRLLGEGSVIRNSKVAYSSNMGIVLGAGSTADNNLVHDIAYDGSYGSGIAPYNGADGQRIINNTIYRTGRSSIDLMSSKNLDIGYNDLYHFGLINTDLGAIYSARDSDLTGSRFHHNWIHDHQTLDTDSSMGINTGIYLDQNAGPVQIDHNVIWFPGGGVRTADLYVQHNNERAPHRMFSNKVFNNTFGSTNVSYSYNNANHDQPEVFDELRNNIYRDHYTIKNAPLTPDGMNALYATTNPKFLNEGGGGLKYRLTTESPAVDVGAEVAGVTEGFIGDAPDIGAYERDGIDWIPGYKADGYVPGYYATEGPIPDHVDPVAEKPLKGILTIDDSDVTETGEINKYVYSAGWNSGANDAAHAGTDHYSNGEGAYYTVKFSGTQVKVYGEKNNAFGILAISIDDGEETLVDAYSASRQTNALLYSSDVLSPGTHTITVRITGEKNELSEGTWSTADRIVVNTGIATVDDVETGTEDFTYEYVGSGWNGGANDAAYAGTDHYNFQADDYYLVRFTGSKIRVYGEKNNAFGIVAVSIYQGEETIVEETDVDLYNETRTVNTLQYESPELAYGSYTLKVRLTGDKNESSESTWMTADRVEVEIGVPLETTTVDDSEVGDGENEFEFVGPEGAWGANIGGAYTDHYSNTEDAYYQVRFTGTQIKLYGEKNSAFGIVGVSIDGGAEVPVDAYSPAQQAGALLYASHSLSPGFHTLKVRLTGTSNPASSGAWHTVDRVVITTSPTPLTVAKTIDDTDAEGEFSYEFVGTWNPSGNPRAHKETDHYNDRKNDYYLVKFTGIQANVYGEKNNAFGIIALSVDGGPETFVDLYSPTQLANTLLYTSPLLSDTSHVLKVRLTGAKNDASALHYTTADRTVVTVSGGIAPQTVSIEPPVLDPDPEPQLEAEPDPGIRYEAEQAALSGGSEAQTDHDGYSGTGFVGGFDNVGAAVDFTVNVPHTGIYEVTLSYANDNESASTASVYVGSSKAEQTNLLPTGDWETWGFKTIKLSLQAGSNTISYKVDEGDTGAINLDYISLPDTGTAPVGGVTLEAEDALLEGGAAANTNHAGYSGAGFVEGIWEVGAAVTFNVSSAEAGPKQVVLRYANGNPDAMMSLFVNGEKQKQVSFPSTGDWASWGYKTNVVALAAGDNTIAYKFEAPDTGRINLDYLNVSSGAATSTPPPATDEPPPTPAPDRGKVLTKDADGKSTLLVQPDSAELLKQLIDGSDEAVVDAAFSQRIDRVSVELHGEVFAKANELGKTIVIQNEGITIRIEPETIRTEDSGAVVRLEWSLSAAGPAAKDARSVSAVYDFGLTVDGKQLHTFDKPIVVSFSYEPPVTSESHKLGVYYFNESENRWEYVGGKLESKGTISAKLSHFSRYGVLESDKTFPDVQSHWAKAAIEEMAAKQIVYGMTESRFAPEQHVTRAQFVAMIARTLKLPAYAGTGGFADVPQTAWYASDVYSAYQAGIIQGKSEQLFAPNDSITREQMAVILVNAWAYATGRDGFHITAGSGMTFTDEAEVSGWAADSARAAAALGLIAGFEDGSFRPSAEMTRAQAATALKAMWHRTING